MRASEDTVPGRLGASRRLNGPTNQLRRLDEFVSAHRGDWSCNLRGGHVMIGGVSVSLDESSPSLDVSAAKLWWMAEHLWGAP
jgi:hypothetical protein